MTETRSEPTGLPTKEQKKEMKEMRSCQRMAGWYGLWSTILAGTVSFGGLTLLPRKTVPKTYVPMISLGCATLCGWCVSVWFTKSCRMKQLTKAHSTNISVDGQLASQSSLPNQDNKFGDQAFFKEEK